MELITTLAMIISARINQNWYRTHQSVAKRALNCVQHNVVGSNSQPTHTGVVLQGPQLLDSAHLR